LRQELNKIQGTPAERYPKVAYASRGRDRVLHRQTELHFKNRTQVMAETEGCRVTLFHAHAATCALPPLTEQRHLINPSPVQIIKPFAVGNQSPPIGARKQVGIRLSYRPAILCSSFAIQFQTRFLESIPRPIAGFKFPTQVKKIKNHLALSARQHMRSVFKKYKKPPTRCH
jgi:hypothetical protein